MPPEGAEGGPEGANRDVCDWRVRVFFWAIGIIEAAFPVAFLFTGVQE
jgi:hypothetical protein